MYDSNLSVKIIKELLGDEVVKGPEGPALNRNLTGTVYMDEKCLLKLIDNSLKQSKNWKINLKSRQKLL